MTAVAKLLPCPFCGEPGEFAGCEQDGHYVRCSGRGCYGEVGENYDGCAMPSHMFSSQADAAAAWNRRAALSPAEMGGVIAWNCAKATPSGGACLAWCGNRQTCISTAKDSCATCCRVDQADAWEAVFDTLQEIRPDFVPAGVTAMDASCALIRELSTPRAAEAVVDDAIRDLAELEPADADHPDTLCVKHSDLLRILVRHFAALTPPSAKGE